MRACPSSTPPRLVRRLAILFGLFACTVGAEAQYLSQEEGSPYYLHTFEPQDYGLHSQNWEVVQDRRGLVYVANMYGVLEFDGRSWRSILLPSEASTRVRSLAVTERGAIAVGGVGAVGYLAPDEVGQLQYHSP